MPLFEFYCGECGVFEMVLGLSEIDGRLFCPSCQSEVQRIFTPPSYYRPFSGIRHNVLKRAKTGSPGYAPWMIKH